MLHFVLTVVPRMHQCDRFSVTVNLAFIMLGKQKCFCSVLISTSLLILCSFTIDPLA